MKNHGSRYQNILTQIWQDEKFIQLSQDAQFLFLYTLTSPHSNSIGCYVLAHLYICSDLKWDLKRLDKPFAELLGKGFILYDEKVNLIVIKNHLKYNPIENGNQVISALKIVNSLPKSSIISTILERLSKPFHKPLVERLGKGLGKGLGKPETETETETETEYSRPNSENLDVNVPKKIQKEKSQEIPFAIFYQAYPRHENKEQARKAWIKLNPNKDLCEFIMQKLGIAKESQQWQGEKRYIPLPSTWINEKRWDDELSSNPIATNVKTVNKSDTYDRNEILKAMQKEFEASTSKNRVHS